MRKLTKLLLALALLLIAISLWQKLVDYRRMKKYPHCDLRITTPNGVYKYENIQYFIEGKTMHFSLKEEDWASTPFDYHISNVERWK